MWVQTLWSRRSNSGFQCLGKLVYLKMSVYFTPMVSSAGWMNGTGLVCKSDPMMGGGGLSRGLIQHGVAHRFSLHMQYGVLAWIHVLDPAVEQLRALAWSYVPNLPVEQPCMGLILHTRSSCGPIWHAWPCYPVFPRVQKFGDGEAKAPLIAMASKFGYGEVVA